MTNKIDANKYNGWANFATWKVAALISNDEHLYKLAVKAGSFDRFAAMVRSEDMLNDLELNHDELDILISEIVKEKRDEWLVRVADGLKDNFAANKIVPDDVQYVIDYAGSFDGDDDDEVNFNIRPNEAIVIFNEFKAWQAEYTKDDIDLNS